MVENEIIADFHVFLIKIYYRILRVTFYSWDIVLKVK